MSITTEAVVNVQGAAEVAEPDVARRAHRAHPRERRSADRRCGSTCATPISPTRRRCRRRSPRTCSRSASSRSASARGPRAERAAASAPTSSCVGEAQIKQAVDAARGVRRWSITKYALTSWTVKCIDRATGEEIYFNTTLPKGVGSWASEEEALKAIGTKIADEFSRDFFLQHAHVTGRKVALQRRRHARRRRRGPARARARRPAGR